VFYFVLLRRYICKKDLWIRVGQKSRHARHSDIFKKSTDLLWTNCWKLSKFLGVVLTLTLNDLKTILHKIQESPAISIDQIAIVPTELSNTFGYKNCTLILKSSKRKLVANIRKMQKSMDRADSDQFIIQRNQFWLQEVSAQAVSVTQNSSAAGEPVQ
jgi:hypothetical protein